MEQDVQKLLQEASMFEALEKNPGWLIIVGHLQTMLDDATANLDNVSPTDTEKVLAAHRDWRAVKQVRDTLFRYIKETKEHATAYLASQKENIQ